MIEKTVALDIQKAYEDLRNILLKNNCRIIIEEPLKSIIVEHGYPSSLSPRETWKRVSFYLFPDEAGTRIMGSSQIIFPIPVAIINNLMVVFIILFIIGFFVHGIMSAALFGLIAVSIVYEAYYRLYRKRYLFLEEVFKLLAQRSKKP
ncbi:MAG: hypothetical protein FGF52_06385 [Candidatus Brockarchaeota archaeon]|nr:hypothetical protein [Candidatus Brockarchaeota archaeon]